MHLVALTTQTNIDLSVTTLDLCLTFYKLFSKMMMIMMVLRVNKS